MLLEHQHGHARELLQPQLLSRDAVLRDRGGLPRRARRIDAEVRKARQILAAMVEGLSIRVTVVLRRYDSPFACGASSPVSGFTSGTVLGAKMRGFADLNDLASL